MNEKITLEIDLEAVKQKMQEYAISTIVDRHFNASDINDYSKQTEVRKQRLNDVVKQVDWNKLPEEIQRGILSKFVTKMLDGFR